LYVFPHVEYGTNLPGSAWPNFGLALSYCAW